MAITTPQIAQAAEDTAVLEITKSASATSLKPGETMEYHIELGCSTITDLGCRGATLSDLIPAEFEIIPGSVSVANATAKPPVVDGNQVTVEFIDPLGDGTVGLLENADAVITIQVKLRDNLPYEANGVPIVNTAVADAENAAEVSDVVTVTPEIELKLSTEVEKAYSPNRGQAVPGTPTTLTVKGTNTSNAGVDSLVLTDPKDPDASPNPFDHLDMTALEALTFPEGAAPTATVEYYVDGAWVSRVLSADDMPNAPPAGAKGIRVTFTAADGGKIPSSAGGGFELDLEQGPDVADLPNTTTVENTVTSEVNLDDQQAEAENEADYTIITDPLTVGATKDFAESELIAGETTGVTLTGTNTSLTNLETLTIREPATGKFGEVDGVQMLEFTGFTGTVQYPTTATGGTVTLNYLDTNGDLVEIVTQLFDGQPFPTLPADFGTLNFFEVTFTSDAPGAIEPGGSSKIEFEAEATAEALPGATLNNEILVTGKNPNGEATAPAEDDLGFAEQHLELETTKKVNPGEMWGYKGETATVQLPTQLKPKPASNANAQHIVVTDPALSDPNDPNSAPKASSFWDSFRPKQITKTDVPAGATLTVRYYDTIDGVWKDLPGAENVVGATSFTMVIPEELRDRMGGLQFDFANENPGFEPGNTVQPNFTSELKEGLPPVEAPGGEHQIVENCAASGATGAPGVEPGVSAESCQELQINNPIIGVHDLLEKVWITPEDGVVPSRSGAHATSRLYWSTGGRTGVDQMAIADTRLAPGESFDPAAGPSDPVQSTVYNAFNLFKIKAITPELDPSLQWDQVTDVQLWNAATGTWSTIAAAVGNLPYRGAVPELALTEAEQLSTTGVRLLYAEDSAARAGSTDPLAPAVGSGVAKTNSASPSSEGVRALDLEWELRDSKRVPAGEPVLGTADYNTLTKGDVNNIASGTSVDSDGKVMGHDDDGDIISIIDRPVGVKLQKGWTGGVLGVPPTDADQSQYPTSRVTLVATNTSVTRLEQLDIIDPGAGGASPFDVFNIQRIVFAPNNVAGADWNKTVVILTASDGTETRHAPGAAVALADTPAGQAILADTVKIQLHNEGRADADGNTNSIESNAKATLVMDLQLRKTHRESGEPVTRVDSPIKNEAEALACDLCDISGAPTGSHAEADDEAQIALDTFELDVQTTKAFTPDQQRVEWLPGDPKHTSEEWAAIRMDLTARPTGTARADKLVVTDSGENRTPGEPSAKSFWNAYRFVGFTDDTLAVPTPVNSVHAEVLFGDFTSGLPGNKLDFTPDSSTPNGDGWVPGSAAPVAVVDGKITGAAAALLANIAPADYDKVRGIRLTYQNLDDAGNPRAFENPANPKADIALDVKRRAYLVSDPSEPVPDSNSAISAPGEAPTAPGGLFTNTVDADAESHVKLPIAGSPVPLPLVASDEATDNVTYLAEGIEVAVEKTPLGAQKPGEVIPFKLKTTNTAPRSDDMRENEELGIADPIIVDVLPMADGKPQLIFDPDAEVSERFKFTLENRIAPASSAMPVNPAGVDVEYLDANFDPVAPGGEPAHLRFTFPDGSVLYPQEVYTITVNMMFRPGVLAGSENSLLNEFTIEADQPFDGCNFDSSQQVNTCGANTEVYPTEAGALRGKKYVRAHDNELGIADVPNPNAGKACVPQFGDVDTGYSFNNCVPITKPLGVETWREELQNTGTLVMDKVVTIDSLPRPGDQGSLVLMPRKSEWQPTWVGNTAIVMADGYRTDAAPTQYYSSSENAACIADLKPTEDQCVDYWTPIPAGATEAELAALNIRHVKTEFDFSANPLQPGERLAYTFETRTPAQAPKMTADTVAWNSIAVGARTIASDGTTKASVLPTEGLRVGVALATGPIAVQKTVTGPGAEFAPETFDVQVVCTVPEREGSIGGKVTLDPVTVTVKNGETVTLPEQFPWGAECIVEDVPGVNGETSSTVGDPVTIGRDTDPVPVAKLTNTYELGSFTVDKDVTGASNQDGDPIDYGSFPVAASCTFLGAEIALDPAETELTADGTKWLVDQLPVGAKCTLTELDPKGARANLTIGNQFVEPNEDGTWTFEITKEQPDIELVLTNVFPLGAISIEKQITGEGAAAIAGDTTFTFSVLCTYEGNTVWDGTVEFTKAEIAAGNGSKLIENLPYGGACTVEETGTGGATSTSITPDTSEGPVEVGPTEFPVVFTAVNTFDAGKLHVTKEITGAGAERWGAGPFEVSLACEIAGKPVTVPEGATRPLTAETEYQAEYAGLPIGAACELTETVTGGATSSEIVNAAGDPVTEPVVIGAGDDLALRVINTFDIGAIEVEKKVTGPGAAEVTDKVFTVALACTIDRDGKTVEIDVPDGAERELSKAGGLTASYEELPVGAACELRETETGGAAKVSITPNLGDPAVGTVTVAAGAAAQLTVVNEFPATPVPPVDPPVDPPKPGKTPGLVTTGGGAMTPWLIGGGVLLVLGAGLLALRARRRKDDSE
ncbi:conserved repeat domain protein [Leucobacter sp. 7(1)]|nr:conserved repeat domain protein [Leucobacter sp. 7(1)]